MAVLIIFPVILQTVIYTLLGRLEADGPVKNGIGINSEKNWHKSTSVNKSTTFMHARYKHTSAYSYFQCHMNFFNNWAFI